MCKCLYLKTENRNQTEEKPQRHELFWPDMFMHAGRHLNRGLKLLINHDEEKTPEALERLVEEFHDEKELCCYQMLNHPGSEDILWGIIRLLACKDPSVSGHAAYIIGTICDMDVGRRRILELVVSYKDQGFDVLTNLTKILYCKDNESIMNASGTIGTLAETMEGRSWMLRKETLDETLSRITVLLGSEDIWTASNAALIIARLTIEEEGCARILNRRDTRKILLQLVNCLGLDKAGKGMNAAFAIGRLCDMESGRRHMLMLKKSDFMLSKLTAMLESDDGGCNKNACFALSCIAGSTDGVLRLLCHSTKENMLQRLSTLIAAEDEETAWFAAMTLRTLSSKKQGCLLLRDHKIVKDALKERIKSPDLKSDVREEISVTLEIIKYLDKPKAPLVKIESATTTNVRWDAVNPKSGMEVTYSLFLEPSEKGVAYSGQETSFELHSLKPTQKYSCRLQTSTEGDESPISNAVSFSMPESVPSAPQNARVLNRTTTQLKLGWDPPDSPNGVVRGYQIYQQGKNGFTDTRDLYHIFINLIPSTEYSFEIYALTSAGRGEKADVTCATVDLREHAPAKPSLHVLGRNEILIQWNPPEQPLGRINYYEVTQDGEVIYSGIERTCTSRRLQPNTEYSFKVAAWTNEGKCESEPVRKKTAKDIKSSFPRTPLYPYDKRSKNGKSKLERVSSVSSNSAKQRAKSISYIKAPKVTRDASARPQTTTEGKRWKPSLASVSSLQGLCSNNNTKDKVQRNDGSARRRHLSTGSFANNELSSAQSPSLRRPADRPSVISFPSPVTKESLIGLSFRPGSYTAGQKPLLKTSYSTNDATSVIGAQDGTHKKAMKSVSFSTPFSKALSDLQAIHIHDRTRFNEFPSSLLTGNAIRSPNSGFQRRRISSSPSERTFLKS